MADNDGSPFSRFSRDFGFYTLTRVIPAFLGLLAIIIFTRLFEPVSYGRYSLALVFVTVTSTVGFGWLEQAVLRFESESEQTAPTALLITGVMSLGIVAFGGIGFLFIRGSLNGYRPFYFAAVGSTAALGAFTVLRAIFQARLDARRVTAYTSLRAVIKLSGGLGLSLLVFQSIVGWLWGTAMGSLLGVLAMLRHLLISKIEFDQKAARRLARYGVPMLGWLVGLTLLTFADRILLELLAGTASVGVYASNYSLVQTGLPLVLAPIIQTAHPIIMDEWTGDNHARARELITEYSRYYLILGVGATVFACLISRPLSTLVLDTAYHDGFIIIPIVAVGLFLWNFAMLGHKGLELSEMTGSMTAGIGLVVVVNIGFNIVLIPVYGYTGAAVATSISALLYVGFAYLGSRRTIRWVPPVATALRTCTAGVVMAGIGITGYLGPPIVGLPVVSALIGGIVYLLVLYRLGELSPTEISAVRRRLVGGS